MLSNVGLIPRSSAEELISFVRYEAVASVARLFHAPTSSSQHAMNSASVQFYALADFQPRPDRNRNHLPNVGFNHQNNQRRHGAPNREQGRAAKKVFLSVRCGKYGHWYDDHNGDGPLCHGTVLRPAPVAHCVNYSYVLRLYHRPAVAITAEAVPDEPLDGPANELAFNISQLVPAPLPRLVAVQFTHV